MVFTNITPFPRTLTPITNISPLTYRDAGTFLEYLETIKQWLNETLVPETDTILESVFTDFQDAIANAEATVNAAKDEWTTEFAAFNVAFETFKTDVNASLATNLADITAEKVEWQTSFDAFMTNVEAEIAVLNDSAVESLLSTDGTATSNTLKNMIGVIGGLDYSDSDASGPGNLAKINAAFAFGKAWKLEDKPGRVAISGPINMVAGSRFIDRANPIRIVPVAQPVFTVDAPDVTIAAVGFGSTTPLDVTGLNAAWELSIVASRWTMINAYSNAHRLNVPYIKGEGFSSVIRVTDWDLATGARSLNGHVKNVTCGEIVVKNCEFGFVVQGTDDFTWGTIRGGYRCPIGGTRPPHLVYFSGTDADNINPHAGLSDATWEGGAVPGQAFQFKGTNGGDWGRLVATGCPGSLNIMNCKDFTFDLESTGDICVDPYGSVSISKTTGPEPRGKIRSMKIEMVSDGIPYRALNGDGIEFLTVPEFIVSHTTSGSGTTHDVSIAGINCTLPGVKITNKGTASWRGVGLWSGDGHRIGRVIAKNVRVGVDVRNTSTNAVIDYNADDITLHPTDGYKKIVVTNGAAPTLRLPGKPSSISRVKLLDQFTLAPEAGDVGPALSGHVWTTQTGTWTVNNLTGEMWETVGTSASNQITDIGIPNYELRADIKFKAYEGFVARQLSITEYIAVYMSATGIVFAKRDLGALTTLDATHVASYTAGRWYDLRVLFYGSSISVYVDNVFAKSYTLTGGDDAKFATSGKVGPFCSASGALSRFKEMRAIQL